MREGHRLTTGDVKYCIELAKEGSRTSLATIMGDIEFIYLADKDVVRHEIVQKTIRAYQQYDGERLASDEKVGA